MDNWIPYQQSWASFIGIGLSLLAIYFVLLFAQRLLKRFHYLGRWQDRICRILHFVLIVFEPLAAILLCSVFVLINPLVHGLFLLLILIFGASYIRNYMSGRLAQVDNNIAKGMRIRTGTAEGIITEMDRMGLYLQSRDGLHYISYVKLMTTGYTLISGDEIGGLYHLEIDTGEVKSKTNPIQQLMDRLTMTPYIDWKHKPELYLIESATDTQRIDTRILLKEESHLHELIALIREWGYEAKVLD